MGSTYLSLHFHVVFGTKGRERCIDGAWRRRLHEYVGGTIRGLGAIPEAVGGVEDHVHLLVGLRATQCLADLVREVKKASSVWVRDEVGVPRFGWQEGYSGFTVSPGARVAVRRYIEGQEEHHRKLSFHEELVSMFRRAGIPFEERFLE